MAPDRQLPMLPEPHRTDMAPPDLSMDRRLQASVEPRIDNLPIMLPRYQGMGELRFSDSRFSESRISAPRPVFPSSPPFTYTGPTNSNMTILEQSRALTTLPLPVTHSSYPIISHHGLFGSSGSPTSTLPSGSLLNTSPTAMLPTSFLYPHLYTPSTPSQYSTYIHTSEGRTLEILGSGRDVTRSSLRGQLTPPPSQGADESHHHHHHHKDASQTVHHPPPPHQPNHEDHPDPASVWRPYWINKSMTLPQSQ